jgi:hypothetical protein
MVTSPLRAGAGFGPHGNLRGEKWVAFRKTQHIAASWTLGVSIGTVCSRKGKIVNRNTSACTPFGKTYAAVGPAPEPAGELDMGHDGKLAPQRWAGKLDGAGSVSDNCG